MENGVPVFKSPPAEKEDNPLIHEIKNLGELRNAMNSMKELPDSTKLPESPEPAASPDE